MATFIERVMAYGDMEVDGGAIDPLLLGYTLEIYNQGDVNSSWIKTLLSLTAAQGNELDEILGTRPPVLLTIINAVARASWPQYVAAILMFGRLLVPDYDTPTKCRTALGL
jgi:hypothetical protein